MGMHYSLLQAAMAKDPDKYHDVICGDDGTCEDLGPRRPHAHWTLQCAQFCLCTASLCIFAIICTVRSGIRRRDYIPPQFCCNDCCEDVWCSLLCAPCTQCMMLRHEGVTSHRYELTSPTGTEEEEDIEAHVYK